MTEQTNFQIENLLGIISMVSLNFSQIFLLNSFNFSIKLLQGELMIPKNKMKSSLPNGTCLVAKPAFYRLNTSVTFYITTPHKCAPTRLLAEFAKHSPATSTTEVITLRFGETFAVGRAAHVTPFVHRTVVRRHLQENTIT